MATRRHKNSEEKKRNLEENEKIEGNNKGIVTRRYKDKHSDKRKRDLVESEGRLKEKHMKTSEGRFDGMYIYNM